MRLSVTYQKSASHQDENALFANRLCVDGVGTVLYLLEGQVLLGLEHVRFLLKRIISPEASLQWPRLPVYLVPRM
jgi:hypothetical protein